MINTQDDQLPAQPPMVLCNLHRIVNSEGLLPVGPVRQPSICVRFVSFRIPTVWKRTGTFGSPFRFKTAVTLSFHFEQSRVPKGFRATVLPLPLSLH